MPKGNAIIGQSGGPTSVINASLAGIIETARAAEKIEQIYGMRFGIEGFMAGNIIDLAAQSSHIISGLQHTPSSALGSCRHKLKHHDLPVILEQLKKHNIRYLFLIGGNDTMDTIHRIEAYAADQNYTLIGIGVPKTVDNDLFGTDHSPGFPSAARYMALSVQQAGVLARDMQKVDQFVVFQTIGREAGWLTAATTASRTQPGDPPHILCLPERPFDKQNFLDQVDHCYKEYGFVSIVCGEGITYDDGTPVSASQTADAFSNIEFGAMGGASAAMTLHQMVSKKFGFRGEFQITESLPMCAADRAVEMDIQEAYRAGQAAVELALKGTTGKMVTLERIPGPTYACKTATIPLKEVAIKAKPMPDEFISEDGYNITDAFTNYLKPLIGPLPEYVQLEHHPVP